MKKIKYLSLGLAVTMGLTLLTGCGKKSGEFKTSADMINKYGSYAEVPTYTGLEYSAVKDEITDADVTAKIDSNFSSFATTEYVTTGTAKDGDTVNIDYVGYVDDVAFDGGNTNGAGTNLVLGSHSYIDDFEEQIVGHKPGDQFDVNVTFPEGYGNAELDGKDAVFKVTLNSIAQITKPEYTDEFIASNTDYKTYSEYTAAIKEQLEESAVTSNENQNKSSLFTQIVDSATINEYPKQELENMVEQTVSQVEEIAKSNNYDLATYVTAIYGMSSEEAFRQFVSSQVEDILKEKIVVCTIAKAQGIEVSKDEIQEYKQELISRYGYTNASEFEEDYPYTSDDYMYGAISDKVMDFLMENNTPVYE